MPKIPQQETFSVAPTVQPGVALRAPEMNNQPAQQLQQAGDALTRAGQVAAQITNKVQQQANQTRVNDATTQAVKARTGLLVEAQQIKGKNALDRPDGKALPDEYGEKFNQSLQSILESLGNDEQRRQFDMVGRQMSAELSWSLTTHMVKQQETYQDETDDSTIQTARDQGALLYGDKAAHDQAVGAIDATVRQVAARKGWDDKTTQVKLAEARSPMDVQIMKNMILGGRAAYAQAYYDQHSAGMSMQARAQMQGVLAEAVDTQKATSSVDSVWASHGPQGQNDPVKLYDMERQLAADPALKDNTGALNRAVTILRQRAQGFNAQQAEVNAGNVNGVYKLYDAGTPLSQIMRTPEWLSLPGAKQHDIIKGIEAENATRSARMLSEEQRKLTAMQVHDKLSLLQNADKYNEYTDPSVLASMTRPQVAALRTTFGQEGAEHLLSRWDALQKPAARIEAKMDTEDFNHVADQLGLNPYGGKKSNDQKRQLGELKFRIENLIDQQQKTSKQPMSRDQKMQLMQQEMARLVTVDRGIFRSDKQIPVINLTPEEAQKVVVPQADRAQIVSALQTRYQKNPISAYEPTEANIRAIYLRGQSPAAGLIPDAK